MSKEKENKEFVDAKPQKGTERRASFRELIDGSIITRKSLSSQLPYVLFLVFVAAMYIGNRYHAEKVYRDYTRLTNEVKDLRSESITTASELMFMSKQTEVVKMVQERGLNLEESVTPPIKIKKY